MLQGLKVTSLALIVSTMVIGCGGGSGGAGGVASLAPLDHGSAVRGFMDGVKSENFTTMAGLWGTPSGIAANDMDGEELLRRLTVMMKYLAHDEYELVDGPGALLRTDQRRIVTVRMRRGGCTSDVPFTVVRANDGWLVQSMDLASVVSPREGCAG
jgi:hypothetical protein